ncbi:MAG TPA: hypothetical protein VN414_02295 [Methanosarcina sp.]|nr:hypothetical protein [Methanosarcina sp.]
MKIKLLSLLLLILAGVIVVSGCVGEEAQVFTYRGPDLYRTILYPYVGLLDHNEHEMQGMRSPDLPPGGFYPDPYSTYTLRDATSLLDRNIEKAENISVRLENGIERHKAEGEDVSRLEALLEEYNRLIKEAKKYRALADVAAENSSSIANSDTYNNSSSENLEREYLIQSQMCMIQANHVLKGIFEELNSLTFASEELNSTSRLISTGTGKALLMGSFTLNLHLENGGMAIMGRSQDSEIDINGDYTFEEKDDVHDKVRLYHINSADVKISGSSKTLMLNGENITLTADGEGYLAFQGNGTYRVEEAGETVKEKNWPKPFFEDEMNSGDYGPDGKANDIGHGPYGKDDNTDYGPDRNNNDIIIGHRA